MVHETKKMTINMYYSYMLHDRYNLHTLLLRTGRLLQQYLVDAYICIEESRLDYIRKNQNVFCTEFLQGVHDAVQRSDTEGRDIGKRTIPPLSFIGGPRYITDHPDIIAKIFQIKVRSPFGEVVAGTLNCLLLLNILHLKSFLYFTLT
uniref:Helitron helicase-like domain-containing protein n=1 Tax=Lactuca sativa TaxID=4236 RepID=A0A9R1UXC7_LACSA|nr:hypothetical protein LSAT_V11C800428230 [Lactuca sativa]